MTADLAGPLPMPIRLIRTLLSPRKLWNAIQMWKTLRGMKEMARGIKDVMDAGALPNLGEVSPENLAALQQLLSAYLGGPDVEEEGEEQEE